MFLLANTSSEELKTNENSASDTSKSSLSADEKTGITGDGDDSTTKKSEKVSATKKTTHAIKSSKRNDVPGTDICYLEHGYLK